MSPVLVDDAFQALGSEKVAKACFKSLLGLIDYPPESYERIVAIAATSGGLSRREIGRHLWAISMSVWNIPRRGFEQLYEQVPEPKTRLRENIVNEVVRSLIASKRLDVLARSLSADEIGWIADALEDPDSLVARERIPLMDKLVELNLHVDAIAYRDPPL